MDAFQDGSPLVLAKILRLDVLHCDGFLDLVDPRADNVVLDGGDDVDLHIILGNLQLIGDIGIPEHFVGCSKLGNVVHL